MGASKLDRLIAEELTGWSDAEWVLDDVAQIDNVARLPMAEMVDALGELTERGARALAAVGE